MSDSPFEPDDNAPDNNAGMRKGLTSYGDQGFSLFLRKAFIKGAGFTDAALDRPVVGIANTGSAYNPCHGNAPQLIEAVKRGVMLAGGLPMDFPTISVHESFAAPTSMYLRNLMSMDTEEMVRAQPMDAVVLIGGCDKTVPAQLMGAISADVPAIQLVTGPMMAMPYRGERLGACTDCRRFWGKYRAGEVSDGAIDEIEGNLATTAGTCAVMGTASTMACVTEALGMSLPDTAAIPAVHADRIRAAEATGVCAMRMIETKGPRPSEIVTEQSVENALRVLLAIGGSTNAIIHLTAIAGRRGVKVSLERLNRLSDETPVLIDLKPTGSHYMQDFHAAGGMSALLAELKDLLHLDCLTVTGETLGTRLSRPLPFVDRNVIRARSQPISPVGGLVALFGSLAPGGAILKRAAADEALFEKEGRAVVFESLEDLSARIDTPDLDVTKDDILVLKNAGPRSASGMPEAGYLPIPKKLAQKGLKDMVRISDARMSGTAFGTVILHITPDAASGGPLALVKSGDRVRLSVKHRTIDLLVSNAELASRRKTLTSVPLPARGYARLYHQHILQADAGCDFDFLRA